MGGMFISYINCLLILGGLIWGAFVWLNDRQTNDVTIKASVDNLTQTIKDKSQQDAEARTKMQEEFNKKFEAAALQQQNVLTKVEALTSTNQLFSGRLDLQDQKLTQISRQLDTSDTRLDGFEVRIAKNETGLEVLRALYDRITAAANKR